MSLPITTEILKAELAGIEKIVGKWVAAVEHGIPGIDLPVDGLHGDQDWEEMIRKLIGEMALCASKCEGIVSVLSEER